jgi:two-component system NtrC family sensor kinase
VARRRPGLWVEIALALSIITISTVLLNAGVFWLLLKHAEEERRTDLVLSLSEALSAQLEIAFSESQEQGVRRVLSAYRATGLDVDELYVVDPSMNTLASVAGEAPSVPDNGLRAALYGRSQYSETEGLLWGLRWVVVTTPIAPRGQPVAALRVKMPLKAPGVPGGPAGFVLAYTVLSGSIISLFGFDLFRRRLLSPIARLKGGTAQIAGGDFGHRVELDAARELEELCGALNAMSTSLADYQRQTVEQVERLEAANEELQRAQAALVRSEKLAGVGRLAAGLAHEVGNPLSAVVGYIELLEHGLGDPALERDLVVRTRRELDRIHRIIQALLNYARSAPGAASAVPVEPLLEQAVSIVQMRPDCRAVTFGLTAAEGLPAIHAEPDKLHQALVNLLINASHAVQSQEVRRVDLVASPVEGGVEITCVDTGPGFTQVSLERALEPFYTTKPVGQGIGLGLAICQQTVESFGGSLSLENRAEGGAMVRIRLPAEPA